ncbi:MAG: hypothetical protein QXO69_00195 [archaeon]
MRKKTVSCWLSIEEEVRKARKDPRVAEQEKLWAAQRRSKKIAQIKELDRVIKELDSELEAKRSVAGWKFSPEYAEKYSHLVSFLEKRRKLFEEVFPESRYYQ